MNTAVKLKNRYLKPLIFIWLFAFLVPALPMLQADGNPSVSITANGVSGALSINQTDSFSLSWNAVDVLTCELFRDGQLIGGVNPIGQTSAADQTHPFFPPSGGSANFTITCTDGTTSVSSSVVVSVAAPAPVVLPLSAPTLSGQTGAQCGGQISLSWNAISGATSYTLSRDGSQITQTASTTFLDIGLVAGSSHSYLVVATNSATSSPSSAAASATASAACAVPVGPQTVFNSDPLDYPVVMVSNHTQFPNSISNWGTSVSAVAGEIVSVGIYYHNSGSVNALNTRTSISLPIGASQNQFTVNGSVSADNAPVVSGSATITLNSNQSLSYIPGTAKWYPNQIQDINQGVALPDYALNNLGTIIPGWQSQGMVVARFQVSNTVATGTIDVTANGQQGPLTISPSGQFSIEWTSTNTLTCSMSSTDGVVSPSGVLLNGQTSSADNTHPYFPATGASRTFTVTCDTGAGTVSDSVTVSVQTSGGGGINPPVLQGTAGAFCGGNISLTWNSVAGATSYKIFRNGTQIATTGNLSFTDTGLTPSTTFNYTVRASDGVIDSASSNQVSVQSSAACAPGSPTTPTGVQATTGPICGGQITISWNAVSGATGYKILRDNGQVGIVSASTTTYVDIVTVSTVHTYSVVSTNALGDSTPSAPVTGTASPGCGGGGPVAATTLTGSMGTICGGEIVLSWTGVTSASFYKIYRAGVQIATTTNLSFIDTGLAPGTVNQYYVIVNAGGIDSSPSNTVNTLSSSACPVPPSAPVITGTAGPACGGQIVLNWNTVSGATFYNVLRGGVFIASTTNLSFTDTVAPSTAFSYQVQAVNSFGVSANSNALSVTSSAACGGGGSGPVVPTITLTAVPNPIFVGATTTLSWTSTNSVSCSAVGGWTLATSTSGSQILSPATTTTFAINCTGPGGTNSATTSVVVLPIGAPTAPINLVANVGAACGGQIDLTWNAVLGANFYNILRDGTFVASTTNLSFTDTGLGFGTSHSYIVRAVNALGTSPDSNTATALSSQQCGGGSGGGGSSSGGGGGGGGSSSPSSSSGGGTFSPIFPCSYLKDYLRIDFINDPVEVIKLQVFLRETEGEFGVPVSGIFDQATFDATSRFQVKYQPDILTPWGYEQGESTGYVYILTKKKINEIVCEKILTLSAGEISEIASFRNFLEALRAQGIEIPGFTENPILPIPGTNTGSENGEQGTTTGIISSISNNRNVQAVAAAVFSAPEGLRDTLKAIFIFLLVLLAAYVVAEESLKRYLKTDDKNTERLRRLAVIFGFLVAAIVVAAVLKYYVIILPTIILLMLLIAFAAWIVLKKRGDDESKLKGFGAIPPKVILIPPQA